MDGSVPETNVELNRKSSKGKCGPKNNSHVSKTHETGSRSESGNTHGQCCWKVVITWNIIAVFSGNKNGIEQEIHKEECTDQSISHVSKRHGTGSGSESGSTHGQCHWKVALTGMSSGWR